MYGFYTECSKKIPEKGSAIFDSINLVFNSIPMAATIDDKVLCVHGGIGR